MAEVNKTQTKNDGSCNLALWPFVVLQLHSVVCDDRS